MTEFLKNFTFRLTPRPTFLEGMGRVFDIGGGLSLYNVSAGPAESDYAAIASDWNMVGQDFNVAVRDYEQKTSPKK